MKPVFHFGNVQNLLKFIVNFVKMKVMKPYFASVQHVFIAKVETTHHTTAQLPKETFERAENV